MSIYLSTGQLLVLPFVIVPITQERYTAAVATLAVTLAVHFVPYAWLYAAPIYLGVAAGATLLLGGAVALNT